VRLTMFLVSTLFDGILRLQHGSFTGIRVGNQQEVVFSSIAQSVLVELGCNDSRLNPTCSFDPAFKSM